MSILVRGVQVKINNKLIIKNMNLKLEEGKVIALLGLNGAGKTTLIKVIAGLISPSKGSIVINDISSEQLSAKERAKQVAYVPQQMETTFDYEVEDFVLMGVTPYLGVFETPSKVHRQRVYEALENLGILELGDKRLIELSGGEKQMVYLARAMVQRAKVMVMDEPTAYLDFKRQHVFLQQLVQFAKENNKTTVFSVHDPNLALQYADEIAIVHDQTIIKTLTKSEGVWEQNLERTLEVLYENKVRVIDDNGQLFVTYKR